MSAMTFKGTKGETTRSAWGQDTGDLQTMRYIFTVLTPPTVVQLTVFQEGGRGVSKQIMGLIWVI